MRARVFASIRQLVGASHLEVEASTLRELVDAAAAKYGDAFAKQIPHCKLVVNGEPVTDLDTPIGEGDEVAILPPVAGGQC
jgi:MoaD family protein